MVTAKARQQTTMNQSFMAAGNMNTHLHNEVNPRMNHSQLELIWVYWCLFGNTSWLTGWFKNHQSWLVFLGWPQSKCWAASSLCSLSFCSCSSGPCAFEDGTCTCERQGRKQTLIKPIQRSILNPAKKNVVNHGSGIFQSSPSGKKTSLPSRRASLGVSFFGLPGPRRTFASVLLEPLEDSLETCARKDRNMTSF